jgi:hypothetical protein
MTEDQMRALVDTRTQRSKDLFRKHFEGIPDDLSLIVLKGHLLVEQALTAIISHYARPSADLGKVRLGFMHKLGLVKALAPLEFFLPEFWGVAKVLNDLRNDFAHELEPKKLAGHLEKVQEMASAQRKVYGPEFMPVLDTGEGTLKHFISVWLGILDPTDALIHAVEKSKIYTVDLPRLAEILRERCSKWSYGSTNA